MTTTEAEAALRRSLALDPSDAQALFRLGDYLLRNGRPPEAVELYRKTLRLAPALRNLHRELGWALWTCKRMREAEWFMRRAVRVDPTDAMAHNLFGGLLGERGAREQAHAELEAAVTHDPSFGPFWGNLAESSAILGLHEEAEAQFKQALALMSNSSMNNRLYGTFLMTRGRLTSARRYLERAVTLDPASPAPRRMLAMLDEKETKARG